LKINLKVKVTVKTEKKYNEKRKIVNIFQNSKWKKDYAIELNNSFNILENMELKHKRVFYFLFIFCFFK